MVVVVSFFPPRGLFDWNVLMIDFEHTNSEREIGRVLIRRKRTRRQG